MIFLDSYYNLYILVSIDITHNYHRNIFELIICDVICRLYRSRCEISQKLIIKTVNDN